jgi:ubiquinone/menaquinone biosynthesis C-methylase UbiE
VKMCSTPLASFAIPPLARTDEPEWMDAPGHDPAMLADNLGDLRRVNRWVGGVWLTLRGLDRLTAALYRGAPLTIVDLATGGADIPRAVARWAQRRGFRASVLATDISPEILTLAAADSSCGPSRPERTPAGGQPAGEFKPSRPERSLRASILHFAVADARCLPFADRGVDVVMCSLALHHQSPGDAIAMLGEMRRVARLGVVVNDIVRCWRGYWGARLLSRTLSSNPLTRHDGPLSVRRAYTRPELRELAERAGLRSVAFDGFLGYRVAMTAGNLT